MISLVNILIHCHIFWILIMKNCIKSKLLNKLNLNILYLLNALEYLSTYMEVLYTIQIYTYLK